MRNAAVTLIKALLISAALLALANYFKLPVFREAGGGSAATQNTDFFCGTQDWATYTPGVASGNARPNP